MQHALYAMLKWKPEKQKILGRNFESSGSNEGDQKNWIITIWYELPKNWKGGLINETFLPIDGLKKTMRKSRHSFLIIQSILKKNYLILG